MGKELPECSELRRRLAALPQDRRPARMDETGSIVEMMRRKKQEKIFDIFGRIRFSSDFRHNERARRT